MKLKDKKTGEIWFSNQFNMSSICELIIMNDSGADSAFISDFDVWLESKNQWKDLGDSFKDKDVITDNYDTEFFENHNKGN